MSRYGLTHGLLAASLAVLTGCAQPPKPLYLWESFPRQQYDALLSAGTSPVDQIVPLEAHAEKARATGTALPPGFRAHLGMLKLVEGDVHRARQLWQDEKTAFPESQPYVDQLLKRLDTAARSEKPA